MKSVSRILGVGMLLLAASCGNGDQEKKAKADADSARAQAIRKATPNKDQFIAQIKTAEAKLKASTTLDPVIGNQMIKAYLDYANIFINDSISPDYLFRSADIASGLGSYDQAIILYNQIVDKYPAYRHTPDALYLEAMVYDSKLSGQDARAKVLYEQLIKDYPKSKLVEDARIAIQNLGKTDEQIIREIEKKNEAESGKTAKTGK